MKLIFGVCLVVFIVFSWFIISAANGNRNCYIAAQKELDASSFQAHANPSTLEVQCLITYKAIIDLGTCVDTSHNQIPKGLRSQFVPLVNKLVMLIRYGMKDVAGLKADHDAECSQYLDTMFEPPDITQ